jgi:hypothetical protein
MCCRDRFLLLTQLLSPSTSLCKKEPPNKPLVVHCSLHLPAQYTSNTIQGEKLNYDLTEVYGQPPRQVHFPSLRQLKNLTLNLLIDQSLRRIRNVTLIPQVPD